MKVKVVLYSILGLFCIFTFYKLVLIYVLNLTSIKSSYIEHSTSEQVSRNKGLYIASYTLKQKNGNHVNSEYLPQYLFIEKEKINYPNHYFYFGKSEIGNRLTINGSAFSKLAKNNEYHIVCKSSTQPYEVFNTGQNNLSFFFEKKPATIYFTINRHAPTTPLDTLVYHINE